MSDITRMRIEQAIQRILNGEPERIQKGKKLSISSVQKEAGLGSGSIYYYPEIVKEINQIKLEQKVAAKGGTNKSQSDMAVMRKKLKEERRIKMKYRDQVAEYKQQLAKAASEHHRLAYALHEAHKNNEQLLLELKQLKKVTSLKAS